MTKIFNQVCMSKKDVQDAIKNKNGLGVLFRKFKRWNKHHGDVLILMNILTSIPFKHFTRNTINRVIRLEFDESIPSIAKDSLRKFGK